MMEQKNIINKKSKWFTRIMLIIFIFFLGIIISYNYFLIEPVGELNSGLIILIGILLILVLSESFDNFSLGKLISISKKSEEKDKKINKLENEKLELLKQLITISSIQSQTQQNTNVYGDYLVESMPTVSTATEAEVQDKDKDIDIDIDIENESDMKFPKKILFLREVKPLALSKYMAEKNIFIDNVIKEAKLILVHNVDPIGNIQSVYSAYYKNDDNKEIFVEFRIKRGVYKILCHSIYVMLSKLKYYSMFNSVDVQLDLVWINLPNESNSSKIFEDFATHFEPSIASGLLRISEVNLTEEEIKNLK